MTAFPPLAVANAVLEEAARQDKSLTIMQLLKLVYISHGWSLGLLNEPLVDCEPEAWQHGPVYPAIYREFRRFGARPIEGLAENVFGVPHEAALSNKQSSVINSVVANYGDMHAFRLSEITHKPGTPWLSVVRTFGSDCGVD